MAPTFKDFDKQGLGRVPNIFEPPQVQPQAQVGPLRSAVPPRQDFGPNDSVLRSLQSFQDPSDTQSSSVLGDFFAKRKADRQAVDPGNPGGLSLRRAVQPFVDAGGAIAGAGRSVGEALKGLDSTTFGGNVPPEEDPRNPLNPANPFFKPPTQPGVLPQAGGDIDSGDLTAILQGMLQGDSAPQAGGEGRFKEMDEATRRFEEINDALKGENQAEARRLYVEAKQQQTIRDSGARHASKKIEESLRDQGVSDEKMKKAIEGSKTEEDRFRAMNRLQKAETLKRIDTTRDERVASRLAAKEQRNEDGSAKNDAAVAVDFEDFFSDLGPDPQSEKANIDFLSKSQKKEYQRIMNEASRGRVEDAKFKRIAKFQKDVEKKRDREFAKKQADIVSDKIAAAKKAAKTKEQQGVVIGIEKQISAITKRLDGDFSRQEKADGGLQDQLREQQDTLLEEIALGATRGAGNVSMIAPDGGALSVPPDRVAEAEAKGAKRA